MANYERMIQQVKALIEDVPHEIANLANTAALLYEEMEDVNWVGFYWLSEGRLILGPFQGRTACIEIPVGKGVCGTAVQEGKIQRIPDVHCFPGHIACDCASNSEIVLPIFLNGQIVGVLDIDSPRKERFTQNDEENLAEIVKILEKFGHLSSKFEF